MPVDESEVPAFQIDLSKCQYLFKKSFHPDTNKQTVVKYHDFSSNFDDFIKEKLNDFLTPQDIKQHNKKLKLYLKDRKNEYFYTAEPGKIDYDDGEAPEEYIEFRKHKKNSEELKGKDLILFTNNRNGNKFEIFDYTKDKKDLIINPWIIENIENGNKNMNMNIGIVEYVSNNSYKNA